MIPEGIVSQEDVEEAQKFLSKLLLDPESGQKMHNYLETNEPILSKWIKESSAEIASKLLQQTSSIDNPTQLGLLLSQAKLEAFLVAYCAFTKFWERQLFIDSNHEVDTGDMEDFRKWKSGILDDKYYNFDPGNDSVLKEAKENHEGHMRMLEKIKKVKNIIAKVQAGA